HRLEAGDGLDVAGVGDHGGKLAELFELAGHGEGDGGGGGMARLSPVTTRATNARGARPALSTGRSGRHPATSAACALPAPHAAPAPAHRARHAGRAAAARTGSAA